MERVKAVREAVGEEIDLMIDANNIFTAYEAIRFGRAVERYNIFWFEEPVEPDDLQGALEVKQALDMPIASGENEYTRWGSRDWLASRAVDIFQADIRLCGGISEWMKMAALASAYHIKMAPHGMPHVSIHALASCANGLTLEIIPRQETYDFLPKLKPGPDGMVEVPQGPGLSLNIDQETLARAAQGAR